jgi:hypothetical protein
MKFAEFEFSKSFIPTLSDDRPKPRNGKPSSNFPMWLILAFGLLLGAVEPAQLQVCCRPMPPVS